MFEYNVDGIMIYNSIPLGTIKPRRESIEDEIAKWIVENLEETLIWEHLERNFEGFYEEEKLLIVEKTLSLLKKSENERKAHIKKRLKEYFFCEYNINVTGFVRFRLKNYKAMLEAALDEVTEKYLCEKEYGEFISLVREYISMQNTAFSVLHIITSGESVFYCDKAGKNITKELESEYSFETDLKPEDKLLTILVLTAPQKIVWHGAGAWKRTELKATLYEIFGDALVFCDGCEICRNSKKVLTNPQKGV